ncbi:MAG: type II secretion system inner membrane protein GspF [Proteobacteria bacterium]|nr:type II secretion system inner membrane protein GspF [Pseudomonadota bacterium]MBU1716964.1 type II secretion system inner membrane protein GspF [Pseudomonadota bacterium]
MGAFEYSAVDKAGRLKKGVLEGDTPRQVRQIIRDRGLSPVSVEAVAEQGQSGAVPFFGRRSISSTDLALITRQLATLVRSGTVLEEALRAIAEQAEKARIIGIVTAVRSKVVEGHPLANALADFPSVFSNLYRATVGAGEQTGKLDLVLERLADHTEFNQQLRQKVMLSLLYPTLLTIVAILVVSALLTYVVPQVVSVFRNINQELPLLTKVLIASSSFLRSNGILILILLVGSFVLFRFLMRGEGFRLKFHHLLLRLPLVSRFTRSINTARFARTFSILTASGVPVLEGMNISAKVLDNLAMRYAVEEASRRVREGSTVHRTLAKSGYFSPIMIHLIASGEASANLDEMLERAAINQERDVETLIAAAMGIFEPLLILVMGGVVLLIVLAILLPIFDLNQLVK